MTGNERMTFCNTGSEAVIAALRVARTVTGRSKVVLFAGAYHGMFDEVLVKGLNTSRSSQTLPIAPGIPRENLGNIVVRSYGASESLDWIRKHAAELAAVLVEPVQSRHPNLQPRDFLQQLREVTRASGTALIFDEVVTGFRVHPAGCQGRFDIRADLATYGKVLAGGMPIGVLAGKAEFMDALDGGTWQFGDDSFPSVGVTFFAGTFVRHPLALAAAKAILQYLKGQGPQLQEHLSMRTADLVKALNGCSNKAKSRPASNNLPASSISPSQVNSRLPVSSTTTFVRRAFTSSKVFHASSQLHTPAPTLNRLCAHSKKPSPKCKLRDSFQSPLTST
jgi:glutamate-1-semialdehyde aminotransferase